MNLDHVILFAIMVSVFGLLIWDRFRYDVVAFAALILAAILGVVPRENVFDGFGHPAVIIIALVLIVSRGLSRSGGIELLAKKMFSVSRNIRSHIGIMAGVSAVLSSFMNNVAALVLLMPLDIQAAHRSNRSPAQTLMPLSFASILGGMVTLIGTPPNIVIATYREETLGLAFKMFDFFPVGAIIAVTGVLYIIFVGWKLIPEARRRHDAAKDLQDLKGYVSEAKILEDSPFIGTILKDVERMAEEHDVTILGLIRRGKRLPGTFRNETMRKNDLLVIEGGPEQMERFIGSAGLQYSGSGKYDALTSGEFSIMEAVVPAGARIEGISAIDTGLLYRQEVILLGISRKGRKIRNRVRKEKIRAGDILLLLGPENRIRDVLEWIGCLPLAERGLDIVQRKKAWLAVGVFSAAILLASLGVLYLPLALAGVVVVFVLFRIVPVSQLYVSVEWPVIVLLGSLIPIGAAIESSGGTSLIADSIVKWTGGLPAVAVLAILMIITMTLSDVLNNVATALIAAPIGMDIAARLNANPDTFLMAVAIASSCAFLTPIGHKNNTIIMGPAGYKFGDYWRMGLPLEILVLLVSIPMLLIFWPL